MGKTQVGMQWVSCQQIATLWLFPEVQRCWYLTCDSVVQETCRGHVSAGPSLFSTLNTDSEHYRGSWWLKADVWVYLLNFQHAHFHIDEHWVRSSQRTSVEEHFPLTQRLTKIYIIAMPQSLSYVATVNNLEGESFFQDHPNWNTPKLQAEPVFCYSYDSMYQPALSSCLYTDILLCEYSPVFNQTFLYNQTSKQNTTWNRASTWLEKSRKDFCSCGTTGMVPFSSWSWPSFL